MIKKLRRKFILVIMSVVAVLIIAAFIAMLVSTVSNLEHENQFTLNNALNRPNGPNFPVGIPEGKPGDRPVPLITVSTDTNSNVVEFTNHIFKFSDSDVFTVTKLAFAQNKQSGIIREYNLRYLIQKSSDGTAMLAFVDSSMEAHVIQSMLLYSAIIGSSTLLLFFGVSVLLARWVVRPVEKAWNSQRQFVADASHELKTPLTVILSNSAILAGETANLDGKTKTRLGNILEEAKRMKSLVDDLLSLARSDENSNKPKFEKVLFSDLLQNAALSFEPIVFEQGKELDYTISENVTVLGDHAHLRQLAEILLDNACKYSTPKSRITVRLSTPAKNEACLQVQNDSETIPTEELTKIFERFYRLDKSRSSSGYGLGLSIASGIVHEHKGKIWASSENGRTTLWVALPTAR